MSPGCQDALWEVLPTLQADLLCMAGSLDTKFVALACRMVQAVRSTRSSVVLPSPGEGPGPWGRLHIVPDAGHAVHVEQPATLLTILGAFLDDSAP